MKKYVFEEYRDSKGAGSITIMDNEREAMQAAEKHWNDLLTCFERAGYKRDRNGVFQVYEINITPDQMDAYVNGNLETPLSELETRVIFDFIRPKVTNKNGIVLDYDAAVQFMDDEIREDLHCELAPCTPQEFFTAYEIEHEKRFGEEWFLSDSNPVW